MALDKYYFYCSVNSSTYIEHEKAFGHQRNVSPFYLKVGWILQSTECIYVAAHTLLCHITSNTFCSQKYQMCYISSLF